MLYRADLDDIVFLDELLKTIVRDHQMEEGKHYEATVIDPPLYLDETKQELVVKVSAESRAEILMSQESLVTSPNDWVFRRLLPDGEEQDEERKFVQVAKFREIAEEEFS